MKTQAPAYERVIDGQPVKGTPESPRLPDVPAIRLQPSSGWSSLRLSEVWAYRELLYFLVWRDVSVRYKQTVLGVAWAVIQPVFSMVVFSLFFGRLAHIPSEGVPYPIFSYAALVPWTFFANALTQASGSLVRNANLITKIYFPRLLIPVAAVLAGLIDFALAFAILLCMMFAYGIHPTVNVIWTPLLVLLALGTALAVGLWLSVLNVQFRDIGYVAPFLIQLWLFATPVVYPSSLVPGRWRLVLALNPMTGVVEGFRWALLGTHAGSGAMMAVSALVVVALLVSGAFYFRRMERTFPDVV